MEIRIIMGKFHNPLQKVLDEGVIAMVAPTICTPMPIMFQTYLWTVNWGGP